MQEQSQACPLCGEAEPRLYHEDKRRAYLQCPECALVFVPEYQHVSAKREKAEYDLHENAVDDEGYRRFLSRLFHPVLERVDVSSTGLDFGCGPAPALSVMLQEAGYRMAEYDLYYADNPDVFSEHYDFITATEVIEHLRNPYDELERLIGCLGPGGLLGVMTKLALNVSAFSRWHYKNDPTHIAFYSPNTFSWIAQHWSLELEFFGSDVILLSKV